MKALLNIFYFESVSFSAAFLVLLESRSTFEHSLAAGTSGMKKKGLETAG